MNCKSNDYRGGVEDCDDIVILSEAKDLHLVVELPVQILRYAQDDN